jgi:hypothetical protein
MADDIHFPKGLPPVSASGQIQRVNRKKRDEDKKPPFEKYLKKEDKEKKKKRRKKKKSDTIKVTGQDSKGQSDSAAESTESSVTTDAEDAAEQKTIDVHV